ncbi:MAG: hypothetical protein R3B93_20650 [Bacteroidia bacterium]
MLELMDEISMEREDNFKLLPVFEDYGALNAKLEELNIEAESS